MTTETLWHIAYESGAIDEIAAPTMTDAVHRAHPAPEDRDQVVAVRRISVAEALTGYLRDAPDLAVFDAIAVDMPWDSSADQWLVLRFTIAVDDDGRIDLPALANFRTLRRRWAAHPSVRFDGGRVSIHTPGPAPADLIRVIDTWLDEGDLDPAEYTATCRELAVVDTRTTRVAARRHEHDTWTVADIPVTALGYRDAEAEAFGDLGEGPVIVLDAVPGFAAGCATLSELDHPDRAAARRRHSHCHHNLPAALTTTAVADTRPPLPAPRKRPRPWSALRALTHRDQH
ncbi:hypothetical protein ACFWPH_28350 [Nocardia sp. NPDC058499]|uniref:hypothetical protein n=1 Tax=Nocardia sp. NPDC058499 TaxID=3346530 RepID=UPI0036645280